MTPQTRLKSATMLMIAGLAPLAVGVVWFAAAVLAGERYEAAAVRDVLLSLAVLAASYLFALLVAAPAALYSSRLSRRYAALSDRTAAMARLAVATALGLPALAWAGIALHAA